MRRSGNIFESDNYRDRGTTSVIGIQKLTIILSLITLIAAIYIIVNFGEVTSRIAVAIAYFLSSEFTVLIVAIGIIWLLGRVRWKMNKRHWRW